MAAPNDCQKAADVCAHITDEKVRFFWLKLGEVFAGRAALDTLSFRDLKMPQGPDRAAG